jgi:diaminohydroxyphosphoribosylaminopyrimidine deaminase/5-amino-6-(5-phosphoribosylamino)uracil reductase
VVISRSLDLPAGAALWDQRLARTLVVHGHDAPADRCLQLDDWGVERLSLEHCEPSPMLEALAQRGCNQVLWECGPELAAAAMQQGCVQQLAAVLAPKLLGGQAARTPVGDLGLVDVNQAEPWKAERLQPLGTDWCFELSAH